MSRLADSPRSREFRVLAWSLQPDHAHFVVEARDRFALGRGMQAVSMRLAWGVRKGSRHRGAVLDGRYHQRLLRTPREVRNAYTYVLLNARKHRAAREGGARKTPRRGAPARPSPGRMDPASSGPWFDGWRRRPPADPRAAPAAAPRTWLARTGWRRHGRIDPGEVPGRSAPPGARRGRR